MADMPIPWKKITRGLPRERNMLMTESLTLEEIRKVVEYPDRRIKSNCLHNGIFRYPHRSLGLPTMGAYTALYIEMGEIVAAKMIVYASDYEEYFTFISPEACRALKEWINLQRDIWGNNKNRIAG